MELSGVQAMPDTLSRVVEMVATTVLVAVLTIWTMSVPKVMAAWTPSGDTAT